MSGVLPSIIYPSTVRDEQARLRAALEGTNASVRNCTKLDPATASGWNLFYGSALGFCAEDPGIFGLGTMMDRAQSYENELTAWQAKLTQAGCSLGVPTFNPNPPPPDFGKWLQYGAWIAGSLAAAYIVGEALSFIPRPARRG